MTYAKAPLRWKFVISRRWTVKSFIMRGNVHTDTLKSSQCRLFGKGVDCVDKQSVNGDRTTTRSCNKVALNRFGISHCFAWIAKSWGFETSWRNIMTTKWNSIGSSRCEASRSDAKQTIDDEAETCWNNLIPWTHWNQMILNPASMDSWVHFQDAIEFN